MASTSSSSSSSTSAAAAAAAPVHFTNALAAANAALGDNLDAMKAIRLPVPSILSAGEGLCVANDAKSLPKVCALDATQRLPPTIAHSLHIAYLCEMIEQTRILYINEAPMKSTWRPWQVFAVNKHLSEENTRVLLGSINVTPDGAVYRGVLHSDLYGCAVDMLLVLRAYVRDSSAWLCMYALIIGKLTLSMWVDMETGACCLLALHCGPNGMPIWKTITEVACNLFSAGGGWQLKLAASNVAKDVETAFSDVLGALRHAANLLGAAKDPKTGTNGVAASMDSTAAFEYTGEAIVYGSKASHVLLGAQSAETAGKNVGERQIKAAEAMQVKGLESDAKTQKEFEAHASAFHKVAPADMKPAPWSKEAVDEAQQEAARVEAERKRFEDLDAREAQLVEMENELKARAHEADTLGEVVAALIKERLAPKNKNGAPHSAPHGTIDGMVTPRRKTTLESEDMASPAGAGAAKGAEEEADDDDDDDQATGRGARRSATKKRKRG